ncbi:hypothetical protein CR513_03656, partial [Mucuna pruriens]
CANDECENEVKSFLDFDKRNACDSTIRLYYLCVNSLNEKRLEVEKIHENLLCNAVYGETEPQSGLYQLTFRVPLILSSLSLHSTSRDRVLSSQQDRVSLPSRSCPDQMSLSPVADSTPCANSVSTNRLDSACQLHSVSTC